MVYNKHDWQDGEIITSDKLNNMEVGLENSLNYIYPSIDGLDITNGLTNAINSARDNFINQSGSNIIALKAGTYELSGEVILPPYVKLISLGLVNLNFVNEQATIKIDYMTDDFNYDYIKNYPKNGYSKGNVISGDVGGFNLVNKTQTMSGTTAIQVGSDNNADPTIQAYIARLAFDNVFINNFDVAVKLSSYNTFILNFYNFHLEKNVTNVQVGLSSNANGNSGENISFYGSVFAGSTTAVLFLIDNYDLNFYGCSFDFNTYAFKFNSPKNTVNMFGGHLENNGNIVNIVDCESLISSTGVSPAINLNSPVIFIGNEHDYLFFGNNSGSTKVVINSPRIGGNKYSQKGYLATNSFSIVSNNVNPRSYYITPFSEKMNNIIDYNFANEKFSITSSGLGETTGYTTTDIPNSQYNKVFKLTGGSDINNWAQIKSPKSLLIGRNKIFYKIPNYQTETFKNLSVIIEFFDVNQLSISKGVITNSGYDSSIVNQWNNVYGQVNDIPPMAYSYTISVVIGSAGNNINKYIGHISVNNI